MKNPKVSIVIPVYNGYDFLAEAIDSALAQTYRNIEVIVVNDGSTDGGVTEEVAMSYGDKINYFYKPNGGVASALNYGASVMSGEYFSWLSHDDLYCSEKIERNMKTLARYGGSVVVYSDYSVFSEDASSFTPVRLKGVPPDQFRFWITIENNLHGCTLLLPKQALEDFGGFDESLMTTQDYDLWFRLASKYKFVHIPEVLVKARSHPAQGSLAMSDVVLRECNSLLSNFITDMTETEVVSSTGKTLASAYYDIASNMRRRGFHQAAHVAKEFSTQQHRSFQSQMEISMSYIYQIIQDIGSRSRLIRRILLNKIKSMLKKVLRNLPFLREATDKMVGLELKQKFSEVYDKNMFAGRKSRSGEGSDLVQTNIIRHEIPKVIKDLGVRSFLDAPCGDWFWMKEIDLDVEHYVGVDIVDDMIEKNQQEYGSSTIHFQCLNLAEDELPKADLIFSRDCLVHLTFDDALKILENFKKSGAKYLLTTTFTNRNKNVDLVRRNYFWRTLNMEKDPFNFPEPLMLINEKCTEGDGNWGDKCLGLWKLCDLCLMVAVE